MGRSKLKAIHIAIIGAVACIIVAVGLWYFVIRNTQQRIAAIEKQYTADKVVADQRQTYEDALVKAQADYALAQAKWARYAAEKMPKISYADRMSGMMAYWRELTEDLGPLLMKWPERTGVHSSSVPSLPAPPVNPNALETTFLQLPVGTFTVTGSYASILNHIRSWNRFNRLVRIDFQGISGTSPALTATYSVTVFEFPYDTAGPTIDMAGGGGAPGGGARRGAGGGMGGAMRGAGMKGGMGMKGGLGGMKGGAPKG